MSLKRDEFEKLIAFSTSESAKLAGQFPAVNVSEGELKYKVEVSAPGLNKTDFKVEINDGVLTICAEPKVEKAEEDTNFMRREFSYRSFRRSFNLEDLVNEEKVDAKY